MRKFAQRKSLIVVGLTLGLAAFCLAPQGAEAQSDSSPAFGGGKVVVANRLSNDISVISVRTDQVIATRSMPDNGEPMYVFYSPIKRRVFVGDRANDRVVAFNATTLEVEGFAAAGQGIFHMWGHTGLGELWVANDIDKTISVIDLRTLETLATIAIPSDLADSGGRPHDIVIGPQGRFAYVSVIGVAGPVDFVVQYDTSTRAEITRAAVGDSPHLSLAPQTGFLYVPAQGSNAVYVLDRETLALVALIAVPGAHGAAMSKDGQVFYTTNLPGGGDDAIYTIDARTLEVIGDPADAPFAVPHNIALSTNGGKLYLTHSGATSDKVTIYRIVGLSPVPVLMGHVTVGLNPFGLAFVP